jgi:uncharacterized delta-60 repeat protein
LDFTSAINASGLEEMRALSTTAIRLASTAAAAIAILLSAAVPSQAAAGDLDPTFGDGGIVDIPGRYEAFALAVDPAGRILYASYGSVGRLLPDGSPDPGFGGDGRVGIGDLAAADLLVQPDGKIVVVGGQSPTADFPRPDVGIVRLLADGRIDHSFSGDGRARFDFRSDDVGMAVAITTKGKLLVVGAGPPGRHGVLALVLRIRRDGELDRTFSSDGVAKPFEGVLTFVSPVGGGKVLVGGARVGGGYVVSRFGVGGRLDRTFGGDGTVTAWRKQAAISIEAGTLQPDGRIILCGAWLSAAKGYSAAIVRFLPVGRLDTSFGVGGKSLIQDRGFDWAQDCDSQDDGRVALAGEGSFIAARIEPEGPLDLSFGDGGLVSTPLLGDPCCSWSVESQADGKILVGGSAIVRYLGA